MVLESALESLAVIPEIPTKLDLGTIASFRIGLNSLDGGGSGITTDRSVIKSAEGENIGIVLGGIQVKILNELGENRFVSSAVRNNLMTLMLWDEGVGGIANESSGDVDIDIIRPRILVREQMTIAHAAVHQKLAIIQSPYSLEQFEAMLNNPNFDAISQKAQSRRDKAQLGIVSPWIEDFQNNTVDQLVEKKAITHKEFLGVLISAARMNKNMMDHGVFWEDQATQKRDSYLLERQGNGRLRLILSDLDIYTIKGRESDSVRETVCSRSSVVKAFNANLRSGQSLSSFRLSSFWDQFIRPEHDDSLVNLYSLLQRQTSSLAPEEALAKGIEILTQIRTEMKDSDTLSDDVVTRYAQAVGQTVSLDDLRKPGNSREVTNREQLYQMANTSTVRKLLEMLERVPGFDYSRMGFPQELQEAKEMSLLREAMVSKVLKYTFAYPVLVRISGSDARECFKSCLKSQVLRWPWDKSKFDEFFSSPDVQQLAEELFKNATAGEK